MDTNPLEIAKNRAAIFQKYLQIEKELEANSDNLAFLDRGIQKSPYKDLVDDYPNCFIAEPDGVKVVSYGAVAEFSDPKRKVAFSPYPKVGVMPQIDQQGLNFINEDIKQACICIGSFVDGKIQAKWLGRDALTKVQCWSATKIIPVLNIISKVNTKYPNVDLDNCIVRDPSGEQDDVAFYDLLEDMVSYAEQIASSNSIAAMFRHFETRAGLEQWVKKTTGNQDLNFRGEYGEAAFILQPELYDTINEQVLLSAAPSDATGDNLVSVYDLTRLVSMLGWHYNIDKSSRLPGARWQSVECLIRAMGHDSARYADVAIETLGLSNVISSPAIISKLGYGLSTTRKVLEMVYMAVVQFIDERPNVNGKPAKLRTLAMTLRGSKALPQNSTNTDREATELDASMAAEVTEILRRVVAEELP